MHEGYGLAVRYRLIGIVAAVKCERRGAGERMCAQNPPRKIKVSARQLVAAKAGNHFLRARSKAYGGDGIEHAQ